jgi:hypothetical protein
MIADTTTAYTGLETTFAGELIGPEHPGYDEARKLCNGMIDKRPVLIAQCTSARRAGCARARPRARLGGRSPERGSLDPRLLELRWRDRD